MKHHFGDFLDRDGDYWTVVPNRERYSYVIGDVPPGSKEITIVTIGGNDESWEKVSTFPNLEELTLHEPTKLQLEAVSDLKILKRLRITHARPTDLSFLKSSLNIEELVLEYVSGFSDLSPLKYLKKLRSLHLENLRRVSDFSGLIGLESLKYLRIDGTLDWKQPIEDFEFLRGLPNLEVLSFGQIINKSPYPALLPVRDLKNLKRIKLVWNMLAPEEYALMEVALPEVAGADWGPYRRFAYSLLPIPQNDIRAHLPEDVIKLNHPEITINYKGERRLNDPANEWYEFTGKKAGRVKCSNPTSKAKCDEYEKKYNLMKNEARRIISSSEHDGSKNL